MQSEKRIPFTEYKTYIQSGEWRITRLEAIERAGGKCQLCSKSGRLHVHHNTYERLGKELPTDLVALCERCHDLYHAAIDKRTAKHPQVVPISQGKKKRKKKRGQKHPPAQAKGLNSQAIQVIAKAKSHAFGKRGITLQPATIHLLLDKNHQLSNKAKKILGLRAMPIGGWVAGLYGVQVSSDKYVNAVKARFE